MSERRQYPIPPEALHPALDDRYSRPKDQTLRDVGRINTPEFFENWENLQTFFANPKHQGVINKDRARLQEGEEEWGKIREWWRNREKRKTPVDIKGWAETRDLLEKLGPDWLTQQRHLTQSDIERIPGLNEMLEHWGKTGHSSGQGGIKTRDDRLFPFVRVHHPYDVGPNNGKKAHPEYDWEEGAHLGEIVDGELHYGDESEFDPKVVEEVRQAWEEGRKIYEGQISGLINNFNKRILDYDNPNGGNIPASDLYRSWGVEFLNTFNLAAMGMNNCIERRINEIHGIISGLERKRDIRQPDSAEQKARFARDNALLRDDSSYTSNPKAWFQTLKRVYMNEGTLIRDNPLGFEYPEEFKESFQRILKEHKKDKNEPSAKGLTLLPDLFNGRVDMDEITKSPGESSTERAIIKDVDSFRGNMFPSGLSAVDSQVGIIIKKYEPEITLLQGIQQRLISLAAVSKRLIELSRGKEGYIDDDYLRAVDRRIIEFMDSIRRLYKLDSVVTSEGKLTGRVASCRGSKVELFIKALYIAQAYDMFRKHLAERGKETFDSSTFDADTNLPDVTEINDDDVEASASNKMIRAAALMDHWKLHELADLAVEYARISMI